MTSVSSIAALGATYFLFALGCYRSGLTRPKIGAARSWVSERCILIL